MEETIYKIKDKLNIFENMYDLVRIVNPLTKKTVVIKNNKIKNVEGTCYDLWKKDGFCCNCISIRAFLEKDTFVKIEYNEDKIILVTASPITIEGKLYVIEFLKDISKNGKIFDVTNFNECRFKDLIKEINEKVIKDELTGIYNRRYIDERLPVDINNSKAQGKPLSIILADIDSFKKINDGYGHVAGDRVLRDFAKVINSLIRKNSDWVGRFGGDEFLIVLNNTDIKEAYRTSEKIRSIIENISFIYDNRIIKITSSFGVYGVSEEDTDITKIISSADENLYKAKLEGKNQSIYDTELLSEKLQLSKLNLKIEEIRDILNEMCISAEHNYNENWKLEVSKYLDKLIVDYLKKDNSL